MIEIRPIGVSQKADANIPNQPFSVRGRMIPALCDGVWTYRIESFPQITQMCFPDYPYDPADGGFYFGAYADGQCIGLAVLRRGMYRYLYLEDLKVDRRYRGQGVGRALLKACMKTAEDQNLQGVYTVGQDNNVDACLFYMHCGFDIGGFDNRVYRGTAQEEKADIFFYWDACGDSKE